MDLIAKLDAYDLGNGHVHIVGRCQVDDAWVDIAYDAPAFLIDALITAARKEGALT